MKTSMVIKGNKVYRFYSRYLWKTVKGCDQVTGEVKQDSLGGAFQLGLET